MKSLIAIILVVQGLNSVVQDCGEWRLEGGGGRGEVGAQNSVPTAALPKLQSLAAIGFRGPLFLSSPNCILPMKLLIGFHLANLSVHVKMINTFLKWYRVNTYASPLMEIKWRMWKSLFWASFSYPT